MNNNKGFNWFFPIAIGAILLFFFSNMNSETALNTIDEEGFYKLMSEGKVQDVLIYKDTEKADVFLTKQAKAAEAVQTTKKDNSPMSAFDFNLGPNLIILSAMATSNYSWKNLIKLKRRTHKSPRPKITEWVKIQ